MARVCLIRAELRVYVRAMDSAGKRHGDACPACIAEHHDLPFSRVVGNWFKRPALSLTQPAPQHQNSVFTQWRATALASFAFASYVRACTKQNVFAANPDKLRGAQAGLDSQRQQRTITAT